MRNPDPAAARRHALQSLRENAQPRHAVGVPADHFTQAPRRLTKGQLRKALRAIANERARRAGR